MPMRRWARHGADHEDESPRLRALRDELQAGRSGALEAFWAGVEAQSTPLVDPVPGDEGQGWPPSSGGLRRPDVFGSALAQSGAFWRGRDGDPEAEWLAREVAATERRPVRFALDVGLLDDPRDVPYPTLLVANRHLRTVLRAKGYEVDYREFSGGHQHLNWQGTLPDGLCALLSGRADPP